MHRKCMRRGIMVALAIIAGIFLLSPGLTFGGVGGSFVPTVNPPLTDPVQIGNNYTWRFTIGNASTTPNDTDTVQIIAGPNIFFTTACGVPSGGGTCPPAFQEDDLTIEITSNGTGEVTTSASACDGSKSFTVTKTVNPNEYSFAPTVPILLARSDVDGPPSKCTVKFTVHISKKPKFDSSSVMAGLQTSQTGRLDDALQDITTLELGGGEGSSTVSVVVTPEISTTRNPPDGCTGAVLNDSAKLSGGVNPTGTITFKLFGPGDTGCGTPICTKDVKVTDNGTYSTPSGCIADKGPGTYNWVASYNGDLFNGPVSTKCGDEPVEIIVCPCKISTKPNPPSGCVGAELNDSANLTDCFKPTGAITFKLFGPDNPTCDDKGAPPIFTNEVDVDGTGTYNTDEGYPTTATGTYHWKACYSGNQGTVCSICSDEVVEITECQGCQGECPYIGIVGNDCVEGIVSSDPDQPCVANPFYFSEKHQQFLYDQEGIHVPVCDGTVPGASYQTRVPVPPAPSVGCEQFRSNKPINQAEICDTGGVVHNVMRGDFHFFGEPNAVITKKSKGYFEWWIRLPLTPSGEINICIQCGILKPNTFLPFDFEAIELCAAETGERIGKGFCTRDQVAAGVNPIVESALPMITAIAYPGPYASQKWKPFHLTAYKNPDNYTLTTTTEEGDTMKNSVSLQVLDGSPGARVLLKSCMDKCVIVKIPVDGQINAFVPSETEADLQAGDLIQVRLDVPKYNTVDIYCHSQSTKIMGIGVP